MGGLGNQLFIYAFGMAKAMRFGKTLVIDDLSGFSHRDLYHAQFALDGFSIKEPLLSNSKFKYLVANRYFWFLARKIGLSHTEVDHWKYDESAKQASSGYFEGYWQSYLYFHEYKDIIKSNLQLGNKDETKICDVKNQILNTKNSVAIGMRFYEVFSGDAQRHGGQLESYYSTAIDLVNSNIENPTYFVFSLNIERAKSELSKYHDRNIVFINPLESMADASLDMYLMSLCDHFIISNSTLYWWAAYLGETDRSMVVAPYEGLPNEALLPHWIKLK